VAILPQRCIAVRLPLKLTRLILVRMAAWPVALAARLLTS